MSIRFRATKNPPYVVFIRSYYTQWKEPASTIILRLWGNWGKLPLLLRLRKGRKEADPGTGRFSPTGNTAGLWSVLKQNNRDTAPNTGDMYFVNYSEWPPKTVHGRVFRNEIVENQQIEQFTRENVREKLFIMHNLSWAFLESPPLETEVLECYYNGEGDRIF